MIRTSRSISTNTRGIVAMYRGYADVNRNTTTTTIAVANGGSGDGNVASVVIS